MALSLLKLSPTDNHLQTKEFIFYKGVSLGKQIRLGPMLSSRWTTQKKLNGI